MACMDAMDSGKPVPCGIEAAMPHLFTVNFLGDHVPVRSFPKESVVADSAHERTYMPGLAEALVRCYEEEKLPHELGCKWAVPSSPIETAGYTKFTGRLFQ
jgi:hypothetical protein